MEIKSKYINADEFRAYSGIDLSQQLGADSSPSSQVEGFIYRIETMLGIWLNTHFFVRIDDDYIKYTDRQKELYKIAIMEQIMYILKNGDLSLDSGYDIVGGKKITALELEQIMVAPNTKRALQEAGILSTKIRGYRKGLGFNGWFF